MKIGLTLGKYAPLHNGHLSVINCALKEMDHVIVIVYNASKTTSIPTTIRANWIKTLYPKVEVIIADDGPQDTGYSDDIIKIQNEYLIKLLKKSNIHSFYSSEDYGEFVSRALNCQNRIVDKPRNDNNVSSTMIRNNVILFKSQIPAIVFRDVKPKIVFIGGPSTGKTTLAKMCSEKLTASYCPEYGREYWFEHQKNHRLEMGDLEVIAEKHIHLENEILKEDTNRIFIDTNILTTISYATYYFGKVSIRLMELFNQSLYRYNYHILCGDDIPFENSWDRSGVVSRIKIQRININILKTNKIPYCVVKGSLEERYNSVVRILLKESL